MTAHSSSESHVTSEELAAYLDRTLDDTACARLEAHMAHCAACRADLVEARSLLGATSALPTRRRIGGDRRRRTWLAAAGILTIASLPLLQRAAHSSGNAPSLRAAQTREAKIAIIAPREKTVDAAAIVFVWRPVEGASTYRVTVTDSSGTPVFATATVDTTATPPAGVVLHRASSYLWYVDGLTSEGRAVTSGVRAFTTSR